MADNFDPIVWLLASSGGGRQKMPAVKIHEYQAKALLREFGVPVPNGDVADTPAQAREIAQRLGGRIVVDATALTQPPRRSRTICAAGSPPAKSWPIPPIRCAWAARRSSTGGRWSAVMRPKRSPPSIRGALSLRSRSVRTGPWSSCSPASATTTPGMARELYDSEERFRQEVDRCAELLHPHLGGDDVREALFGGTREEAGEAEEHGPDLRRMLGRGSEEHLGRLERTEHAQPALFVVEYALAQLWMAGASGRSAMIGHSLGEYVAACLAGVFSLEDALAPGGRARRG